MGAKVVTMSDSTGWVYDAEGIDLAAIKEIKEVKRARLTEYKNYRPNSEYHEGRGVWNVKCDIALPCATQNELLEEDAKALVANGCIAVAEGANMPTTIEATKILQEAGVLFAPGKAANAGGVATSALEMTQNSERLSWTFEEVDQKLKGIMENIFKAADAGCREVWPSQELRHGRQHRRLPEGCRCHAGSGRDLRESQPLWKRAQGKCPGSFFRPFPSFLKCGIIRFEPKTAREGRTASKALGTTSSAGKPPAGDLQVENGHLSQAT